jgi:hypothetical protein
VGCARARMCAHAAVRSRDVGRVDVRGSMLALGGSNDKGFAKPMCDMSSLLC